MKIIIAIAVLSALTGCAMSPEQRANFEAALQNFQTNQQQQQQYQRQQSLQRQQQLNQMMQSTNCVTRPSGGGSFYTTCN